MLLYEFLSLSRNIILATFPLFIVPRVAERQTGTQERGYNMQQRSPASSELRMFGYHGAAAVYLFNFICLKANKGQFILRPFYKFGSHIEFESRAVVILFCNPVDFCWLYYQVECLLQHTEDSIMPPACQTKLIPWTRSKARWQLATIHQKFKRWGDENKQESICINKLSTLPEWWRYSGNTPSSSPWPEPVRIHGRGRSELMEAG